MSFFGLFGKPSRDEFVALVLKEAKQAGGFTDYIYNKEDFTLKREKMLFNLGNFYEIYCHAKRDRKKMVMANFIGALVAGGQDEPLSFEQVQEKLVVVVRERALLSSGSLWWQLEFDEPSAAVKTVHEPFSAWFTKALVIDFPTHVTLVTHDQLKEWNITFDEACALGLDNLRRRTAPTFTREGGVFIGAWKDDYDSSRVLLPDLLARLELDGDPVVALPNRVTLLAAGSNDTEAVRAMLVRAEAILRDEPKPQNAAPLVVTREGVLDFRVGADSPLYNEVQRTLGWAALSYYEDQKQQLEKLYKKKGKELFVASCTLSEAKDGKYASHCVWTKGVAALLPTTDTVFFFDPKLGEGGGIAAFGPWSKVAEVVGDLMLDTQMFPTRHYVSAFPTAEQLREIGGAG